MPVIYGLEDQRDGLFFYVGQTEDVYKRYLDHIQCSGNNYEKNAKITEMRSQNVLPLMRELERTEDTGFARVREAYWINHFISLGHPITNIAHSNPKFMGKVLVRSKGVKSPKEAIKKVEQSLRIQPSVQLEPAEAIPQTSPSKFVSSEKRETIKRLAAIGMAHRDAARIVGLSGRNYHVYQQICREESIAIGAQEGL